MRPTRAEIAEQQSVGRAREHETVGVHCDFADFRVVGRLDLEAPTAAAAGRRAAG